MRNELAVNTTECENKLKIGFLNINRLYYKLDQLQALLYQNDSDFHIFCLNETFLNETYMDYEVNIPGYNIFRRDRKGKQGGGVAVYVKSSVPCVRRNNYEKDDIEALWIEIPLRNLKNVLLCVLYRPPDSKTEWSNIFLEMMTNPCNSNLDIIVIGDFNLNLLNGENKKWLHDVESLGLTQVVKLPTRNTECTSTLIDHVYTLTGDVLLI